MDVYPHIDTASANLSIMKEAPGSVLLCSIICNSLEVWEPVELFPGAPFTNMV